MTCILLQSPCGLSYDVSASSCCSLIWANTCWVLSTCADWIQIVNTVPHCVFRKESVVAKTLQESQCLWLERARSGERDGQVLYEVTSLPASRLQNLQKRRSWKQKALWQCWVDRLMKVNKAIKYVEPKQKEVTESVPSFDSRIKIRFKKNKCVRTAACCLQRDAYFLGNWANSNNNGQSHEKRFMLNITHYHKMLISIALTGGPKKQISAVWWQLLGFQ